MTPASLTITINATASKITAALNAFGEAVRKAVAGLTRFGVALTVATQRVHGPRNFTGDGLWQSDLCGAWVHDSCPLAGNCDCTCHGGTLR